MVRDPRGTGAELSRSGSRPNALLLPGSNRPVASNRSTGLVTPLSGTGACLSATVSTCAPLRALSFLGADEGQPGGAIALSLDGRIVLVVLQSGEQLDEGELLARTGRYEVGGVVFEAWEIEELEDVT